MTKAIQLMIAIFSLLSLANGEKRDNFEYESCANVLSVDDGAKFEERNSYAWMASIKLFKRFEKEHFVERLCAGSIISKRLILTAASCFTNHTKAVEVTLGSANGTVYKRFTRRWKLHEDFREINKENDLALIELNEEIAFDDYRKPICVPKAPFRKTRKRLNLIDFNETRFQNGLRESFVWFLTEDKCRSSFLHQKKEQFCGIFQYQINYLNFHVGAPLIFCENIKENNVCILVGVLSSSRQMIILDGFKFPGRESIFTNVSSHLDWLREGIKSSEHSKCIGNLFLKTKQKIYPKCGMEKASQRIYLGREVESISHYPWLVFLK
ncbi:trypsin-1-like protein, partial [Dinothrombium tinctorium]